MPLSDCLTRAAWDGVVCEFWNLAVARDLIYNAERACTNSCTHINCTPCNAVRVLEASARRARPQRQESREQQQQEFRELAKSIARASDRLVQLAEAILRSNS